MKAILEFFGRAEAAKALAWVLGEYPAKQADAPRQGPDPL